MIAIRISFCILMTISSLIFHGTGCTNKSAISSFLGGSGKCVFDPKVLKQPIQNTPEGQFLSTWKSFFVEILSFLLSFLGFEDPT